MSESKYLKQVQGNGSSTTLSSSISNSDTSAPLTSDTAFQGEGMVLIDEGQATEEFAYATGKVGSSLTTLLDDRGLEGGSPQAHSATATVKGIITAGMWNNVIAAVSKVVSATTGALLKATGATVNTGTDDATIVTPKAIADSYLGGATSNLQEQITALPTASSTTTFTNKTLTSPKINEDVALTATATQLNAQVLADNNGWISANESWSYASATTITVPSGAASKYAKGDKIKLTQTTVKYFYIIGVADTVLTITGGASYTLTNAAITLNYYSHQVSPIGFPKLMSLGSPTWTTTGTSFTNAPSAGTWYFWIIDGTCYYSGISLSNGTSGGTGIFIATFTSGYLPPTQDGFGTSGNISSFVMGMSYTQGSVNDVIKMCKYDGTAIAGNSQYFGCTGFFRF